MLIQEVSEFAPQKLRELEETFKKLKRSYNNKKARITLIQQIKDFTKIPEVVLFVDDEFNAGVITVYKSNSIKDIFNSFLDSFKSKQKVIPPDQLKQITSVQESAAFVERIYVFIGKPLLSVLTPSELVGVFLHEFGHVFAVTSSVPQNILFLLQNVLKITYLAYPFLIISGVLTSVSHLLLIYIFLSSTLNGITFTEHAGEYRSDNFALKYGYGDELILALNKFQRKEKGKVGFTSKIKEFLKLIVEIVQRIFVPLANSTHPDTDKRISKLEDQMFNEFKKIYPKYRELFDLVRADYKIQEAKFKK